jgi:hypothetical protein
VAPAVTAGAGAWYGARLKYRQENKAELRSVLDTAMPLLERADQRRGAAPAALPRDGTNTTERSVESLIAFRQELSEASQLRDRIAFRVEADSPLLKHYAAAVEGLGEVSGAIGVAVMWPNHQEHLAPLEELNDRIEQGDADFRRERERFITAAQKHLRR